MKFQNKHDIIKIDKDNFKEVEGETFFEMKLLSQGDLLSLNKNELKSDIEIAKTIFAESIQSWGGVYDLEGKEMKFSKNTAKALFNYSPEFFSSIYEKAMELSEKSKKKLKTA